MSYVIVETDNPENNSTRRVFGPCATKEEALELKQRLAKGYSGYLKVRELNPLEEIDPFNYVGNIEITE